MESYSNYDRHFFNITYYGLKFEFELFTKAFILNKLEEFEKRKIIPTAKCISIPKGKLPFAELKKYYQDEQEGKRYYFAYIKFFEYEGEEYGLVGGKTNYRYPDINFDTSSDTIARNFLMTNMYEWSREIVIVNYKEENIKEKKKADKQAKFLEKFLQRQFNLLDS